MEENDRYSREFRWNREENNEQAQKRLKVENYPPIPFQPTRLQPVNLISLPPIEKLPSPFVPANGNQTPPATELPPISEILGPLVRYKGGFPEEKESQTMFPPLTTLASYQHPLSSFQNNTNAIRSPPTSTETSSNSVVTFENYGKAFVELEDRNDYESIKFRETTYKYNGEPKPVRMHSIDLSLANLRYLEFDCCKQLTSIGDSKLFLPNLQTLKLSNLPRFSSDSLMKLLTLLPKLECFTAINLNSLITLSFPASLTNLTGLELTDCRGLETLSILTPSLQSLTICDGRSLKSFTVANWSTTLYNLHTLKLVAVPELSRTFFKQLRIRELKIFELVSNASNAKTYMHVDSKDFDAFIKTQTKVEELHFSKVYNIMKSSLLHLFVACTRTLTRVVLDITCVEKVKFQEILKRCPNLQEMKVEKWYLKKNTKL